MELHDYWVALSRYRRTVAAVVAACLAGALAVVLVTPNTYEATAQVFVASTGEGTSGSQFVNQRVTSYPDVAESRSVLGPVLDELELDESLPALRARVSAVNPPDTSQIDIAVTDGDAARAAEVANAVAERFSTVVEELERPRDGISPVGLTVTDPATVPTTPVSPVPHLLLGLGLVVGLALGAAAAIVRSRRDTRVHTAEDVRAAWGDEQVPPIHCEPARRARRDGRSAGRPAVLVARRLEPPAEQRPVRVVLVSPGEDLELPRAFARDVVTELTGWGVPAALAGGSAVPATKAGTAAKAGVQLTLGALSAPLREWRRLVGDHDGAVLVLEAGRHDSADLVETRSVLAAAGVPVLDVVLLDRPRRVRAAAAADAPHPAVPAGRAPSGPASGRTDTVGAGRR